MYPPSSEFTQTIYRLDDHEDIDSSKVNQDSEDVNIHWEEYGNEMSSMQLGTEAIEWRVRAYIIIKAIYNVERPEWLTASLKRLMAMYKDEKAKARRLLSHRHLDVKSADNFLIENGINLSANEPEFTAYYIFYNFLESG